MIGHRAESVRHLGRADRPTFGRGRNNAVRTGRQDHQSGNDALAVKLRFGRQVLLNIEKPEARAVCLGAIFLPFRFTKPCAPAAGVTRPARHHHIRLAGTKPNFADEHVAKLNLVFVRDNDFDVIRFQTLA